MSGLLDPLNKNTDDAVIVPPVDQNDLKDLIRSLRDRIELLESQVTSLQNQVNWLTTFHTP